MAPGAHVKGPAFQEMPFGRHLIGYPCHNHSRASGSV